MSKENTSKEADNSALRKTNVIGRLLCKIGIHRWQEGYSGSIMSPVAHKCKRCKIVRVFHGWGYTYGRDANDQYLRDWRTKKQVESSRSKAYKYIL